MTAVLCWKIRETGETYAQSQEDQQGADLVELGISELQHSDLEP
jgi:hypothetical protein